MDWSRHPLVAIVGRPNVGKSTLYNRMVGGRPALVHDTPGLTRDRRYGEVEYFGRYFRTVDTGGLDPEAESDAVGAGIHRQAHAALAEAAAVIFVVDGHAGVNPIDREVATMLRKLDLPVICAVNKIDGPKRDDGVIEFYELALGELFPVSAAHGRGVDAMLEAVVALLPEPEPEPEQPEESDPDADEHGPLRIAFVGKPNVGKSSLVNCLVGAERSLVHDAPGTTTDPVDTPFDFGGTSYVLVDTAGMRRRVKIDERTEQLSVSMALGQIRRCHVAVLVIDATEGPSVQDQRIAGAITDAGRALVVVLNKADLLGPGEAKSMRARVADELHFIKFAPPLFISALRGEGLADMMERVDKAAVQHTRRISTAELNKFFAEVCETNPPPTQSNQVVRIHYLTQAATRPPTFLVWANRPKYLAASYQRFLINSLRKRYGFEGTPLRLIVKRKKSHGNRDQSNR